MILKMISKHFTEIISLVSKDKYIRFLAIFFTVFAVLLGIFVSPLAAAVVYTSYISGYVASWFFIRYQNKTSVYLNKFIKFYHVKVYFKKKFKQSCSICDDLSCKRHQVGKVATPWKHLIISKDLNTAVEDFYNKILENFVTSWYNQLTDDTDFVNELRFCLKYATATLATRFLELDAAEIIANKLLPCATKHVDDFLHMRQIAKLKNVKFNDVAIEYLGKNLHAATDNRKNELGYLQYLSSALMKQVLPDSYLKCRNYSVLIKEILAGWVLLPLMDVLADPNIINSLVILAINHKSKKTTKQTQNYEVVEFLENFVTKNVNKKSPFVTSLNKIKNNTDLLYAFMQFLKKQEHVNLLQFCLDVDDFNNRLLTPDLSKKLLEELHSEAIRLHKEYLDENSMNFICCPKEICVDFKSLIRDIYSVAKLRTSKPLYQAYDHTFNVLETVWLPQFFHSTEFYDFICGSKASASYTKISIKSKKYYEPTNMGTVSKISTGLGKIKGVLKSTQPIDGSFFPIDGQNIENGTVDEIILADCKDIFRDLSTWTVKIPSYQTNPANKVVYFCVYVQRFDVVGEENKMNWVVLRKDQDFYTLKAKLVEFHGENEISDSPLPSRKAGSAIDARSSKYEDFVKKLLRKPSLKGSDLLHTFLTTDEDFTMVINTPNSSQDIGNIYQSVAYKLRKEKGQYLDSFMSSFLSSTGKSKQEKFDWAESGDELDALALNAIRAPPIPKTYRNRIFNDNFGIPHKPSKNTSVTSFNPAGIVECIFYLLKTIFKVPNGILKIFVAVCSVAQQLVDVLCKIFIDKKLKSNLSQPNLAYLIRLLEDVIFNPHVPPTKEDLEKRRKRALNEIENVFPTYLNKFLGGEMGTGASTLLKALQNPHYNKQLAYNLLDIILVEMFPDIGKTKNQ